MKNLLAILLLALVITSCNKEEEEEVITTLNTITLNKDSADVEIFDNLTIEWTSYRMYVTDTTIFYIGPLGDYESQTTIYDTTYVLKIKFKGLGELSIESELPLQPQEGDITSKQGVLLSDSVSMTANLSITRDIHAMTGSNIYHSKVVLGAEQDIVINTDLSIDSEGNHTITQADLSFKGSEIETEWFPFPTTKTIDIHIER
jgi:hypothetical protein